MVLDGKSKAHGVLVVVAVSAEPLIARDQWGFDNAVTFAGGLRRLEAFCSRMKIQDYTHTTARTVN